MSSCSVSYDRYSVNSISPIVLSEENQICAQGNEVMDVCTGDSGSPFMNYSAKDERFILIGMVSFGPRNCGVTNIPGVYTKVSSYIDWIEKHLK